MTSSPEHAVWAPLTLERTAPRQVSAAGPDAWLPALSTAAEDRAQLERATLQADAFARGAEEAKLRERQRLEEQARAALATVHGVAERLSELEADLVRDRERDLQAMAVAVARHLVQGELIADPNRLAGLIQRALDLLPLDLRIEVRLNPADLAVLGAAVATPRPEGRAVELVWIADPAVERGGFMLETPQRIIDGRVDVALRDLYERLGHE